MSWPTVVLILGIVWAIVGITVVAGWVSTYCKDDLEK